MVEEQVLNSAREYAAAVRELMEPSQVILYGSQAKGTATPDSDIDIAVIVQELPQDYLSTMTTLWRLTRKINDTIELVLLTADDDRSGFLSTVRRTGVAV